MYVTQADILGVIPEAELIQLTDDAVPPVAVNSDVVNQAISQAESIINGYIGGRYELPLITVPELVKTFALDIACYKLTLRRKKKEVPAMIKTAYDNAVKMLLDVSAGRLSLGVDRAGASAAPVAGGSVEFTTATPVFTTDTLRNF